MTPVPYYSDDLCILYHADALEEVGWLAGDVMLSDPPYGIGYRSNSPRLPGNARSIEGDEDTSLRDEALVMWGNRPALIFGSWKQPRPVDTKMVLIWDTLGANAMGDLSIPWKPAHQEIYVLGKGFVGKRTNNVLAFPPVQSVGRFHPHQKPLNLLHELISKCPPGVVVDPFAGIGSTLIAAKAQGRQSIGVEIDERYCERAAGLLSQEILRFDEGVLA